MRILDQFDIRGRSGLVTGAASGIGAGAAATGASAFGGNGSSIRNSPVPSVCTIGSPLATIVATQSTVACLPTGELAVVFTGKTSSLVSLVISFSTVVTSLGRPTICTLAAPSKSLALVIFTTMSVALPFSVVAARNSNATNGSETSSVAICDATVMLPSPTVASPSTTIFHLLTSAPLFAVSGIVTSDCPSGIEIEPEDPTPGGL